MAPERAPALAPRALGARVKRGGVFRGIQVAIEKRAIMRDYAIQTLGGKDVLSVEDLVKIAHGFEKIGVGVIAWEGGEPLLRFPDLLTLIRATTPYTDAWIATTAYGLTTGQARQLRKAGLKAAIISLDHYDPEKHNKFRGNDKAFDMAVKGVKIFRENGILPSIAICATKEIVNEGGLYQYLELAKQIGVGFVQVLDATPSGNYIDKDVTLSSKQLRQIQKFQIEANINLQYRDYPSVSARALLEHDSHFGCTAGNGLVYVDNVGNLQPCDLLQIAFGNVRDEGVEVVYKRMKEFFPYYKSGRCPAQSFHSDIAKVYQEHNALPLPYDKCQRILEKIGKRGLTPKLQRPGGRLLALLKAMLENPRSL